MAAIEEGYERKEDIISADQFEGTAVYDMAGAKVGTIKNIMIDKLSGKVVYAILATGGVLGVGSKHYPLPWNVLTYNTDLGGYQLDIDREKLEAGPLESASGLEGNDTETSGREGGRESEGGLEGGLAGNHTEDHY